MDAMQEALDKDIAEIFDVPQDEAERRLFYQSRKNEIRQLMLERYPDMMDAEVEVTDELRKKLIEVCFQTFFSFFFSSPFSFELCLTTIYDVDHNFQNPEPVKRYFESNPHLVALYSSFDAFFKSLTVEGYEVWFP